MVPGSLLRPRAQYTLQRGEGGYLFIHDRPYDPEDELPIRFSGIVSADVIQEVIDEMHAEVGEQWASVSQDGSLADYDYDYDERFALYIDTQSEPLQRLHKCLQQARLVLTLEGDQTAKAFAKKLVFSAAMGGLESYLWETAYYWVEKDDTVLQHIVTKLPVLRDELIKLGDIFERRESLRKHAIGYLQNLVWHRWDKVKPLFKHGFGIDLPSVKSFESALVKRHDIVHRNGFSKTREPIEVTSEEIENLCKEIEVFATKVNHLLADRDEDSGLSVSG